MLEDLTTGEVLLETETWVSSTEPYHYRMEFSVPELREFYSVDVVFLNVLLI